MNTHCIFQRSFATARQLVSVGHFVSLLRSSPLLLSSRVACAVSILLHAICIILTYCQLYTLSTMLPCVLRNVCLLHAIRGCVLYDAFLLGIV